MFMLGPLNWLLIFHLNMNWENTSQQRIKRSRDKVIMGTRDFFPVSHINPSREPFGMIETGVVEIPSIIESTTVWLKPYWCKWTVANSVSLNYHEESFNKCDIQWPTQISHSLYISFKYNKKPFALCPLPLQINNSVIK